MPPTAGRGGRSTSSQLAAVGALLATAVLLLMHQERELAVTSLLGLLSGLALLGWMVVARVGHEMSRMDEDQLYDGGDRGGVLVFLPLGLSALWLLLFAVVLASRAVLRVRYEDRPILSQAVVWDAKLFASTTGLGLLLMVVAQCFPRVSLWAKLLPPLLLAAAAALALSADAYCGSNECYSTLGVQHDMSPSALKKAFRRRSLACFPEAMVCSEAEWAAVQLSYDVLSTSMRRDAYDAYLLCRTRQWELLCRLGWAQ